MFRRILVDHAIEPESERRHRRVGHSFAQFADHHAGHVLPRPQAIHVLLGLPVLKRPRPPREVLYGFGNFGLRGALGEEVPDVPLGVGRRRLHSILVQQVARAVPDLPGDYHRVRVRVVVLGGIYDEVADALREVRGRLGDAVHRHAVDERVLRISRELPPVGERPPEGGEKPLQESHDPTEHGEDAAACLGVRRLSVLHDPLAEALGHPLLGLAGPTSRAVRVEELRDFRAIVLVQNAKSVVEPHHRVEVLVVDLGPAAVTVQPDRAAEGRDALAVERPHGLVRRRGTDAVFPDECLPDGDREGHEPLGGQRFPVGRREVRRRRERRGIGVAVRVCRDVLFTVQERRVSR